MTAREEIQEGGAAAIAALCPRVCKQSRAEWAALQAAGRRSNLFGSYLALGRRILCKIGEALFLQRGGAGLWLASLKGS